MMLQEFETLTGVYPTSALYAAIEEAYIDYQGDKADFCRAYRDNADGLAENIRNRANMSSFTATSDANRHISEMKEKIKRLQRQLDQELEWKPYESKHNVLQADYERLVSCVADGGASFMTDDEAKDLLYREYGFAREMVTIVHEVDIEEVNRHGMVRKAGRKYDRRPVYSATDHHYIRFNASNWYYEVWNRQLQPFYD